MRTLLSLLCISTTAVALSACGDDSGTGDGSAAAPTATSAAAVGTTPAEETPAAEDEGSTTCKEVSAPPAKDTDTPKPTGKLDPNGRNLVKLSTSCGTITIALEPKQHPKGANVVAKLVQAGYYDETIFHRVVPGFVIQGGDPTGTGTGGPSWTEVEAPPADQKYPEGTVAMAKSDPNPGVMESQFFIMSGSSGLDAQYAVVGHVVSGLSVVRAIDALGDPASATQSPTRPIVLSKATFER